MSNAPLYQRSVAPGGTFVAIQPALGGIKNLNQLSEMSARLGEHLQTASENIFNLNYEKHIRTTLDQIYQGNKDNPEAFKQQSEDFWEKSQSDIPFANQNQSDATFTAISQNYMAQSKRNFEEKLNNELQISALESQELILNDIVRDSKELMVFDSLAPDATQSLQAAASLKAIEQNMHSLEKTMSMPGVDGRPLFSAEAQFRTVKRAEEKMGVAAAESWMEAQPDKVSAYKAWKNDQVSLRVADENGKIQSLKVRERFNSDVLDKIDREFLQEAKHQLSEFRQERVLQDKELKSIQEQQANDFYIMAEQGILTVNDIEKNRDNLTPKDFRTLYKLASETESGVNIKSDLNSYVNLARKIDTEGADTSGEIMTAVEQRKLSKSDAVSLLNRNNGVTEGAVKEGRHHLLGLIGVNKMISNETQTATAANAEQYYADRIKIHTEENKGRQPTLEETRKIAEEVAEKFTLVPIETRIQTLPRPKRVPEKWKFKTKDINPEDLDNIIGETIGDYVEKYNPTPKGSPKRTLDAAISIYESDPSIREAIERDREYLSDKNFFNACEEIIGRTKAKQAAKERVNK